MRKREKEMASASETRRGPYNLRSGTTISKQQKSSGSVGEGEKKRKSVMVAKPKPKPKPKSKRIPEEEFDYNGLTREEQSKFRRKRALEIGAPSREPTEKSMQEYLVQNIKLANLALVVFNCSQSKAREYELERTLETQVFGISRYAILHTNFEARMKSIPDAPVELFFAEVQVATCQYVVNRCHKFGPVGQDINVFTGCTCDVIKHPVDGNFYTGKG